MKQTQCVPAHSWRCIMQWSSCCCRQCLVASLPVAQSQLPMPLQVLDSGLSATGLPYSYGFAIITLTILVKVATFPLSKKQVCGAARSGLSANLVLTRPV